MIEHCRHAPLFTNQQVVEKLGFQDVQKGPDARRARNRRAEAYLLIRWSEAIEAQRSRWAFFNSLLNIEPPLGFLPPRASSLVSIYLNFEHSKACTSRGDTIR